jgi:predicted permease
MVRIALPLYFFTKLSQTNPDDIRKSLIFPGIAVCVVILNFACAALIFRLFPGLRPVRRVGMALSTFGNSGMIPLTLIELCPLTLPILSERFGTTTPLLYVGTYLLVLSPLLWSIGNFLITGTGRYPKVRELITPPLLGILAGLAVVILGLQGILLDNRLPFFYMLKSLERFGAVTYPVILVCLGAMIARIQFRKSNQKELFSLAMGVSAIRFLLLPGLFLLLYWGIIQRLALSPAQQWVIFLEVHIPPATNLSMMAAQADMNEDQVSFTIFVTYLVYMLMLPVYLLIFLSLPGIL